MVAVLWGVCRFGDRGFVLFERVRQSYMKDCSMVGADLGSGSDSDSVMKRPRELSLPTALGGGDHENGGGLGPSDDAAVAGEMVVDKDLK